MVFFVDLLILAHIPPRERDFYSVLGLFTPLFGEA